LLLAGKIICGKKIETPNPASKTALLDFFVLKNYNIQWCQMITSMIWEQMEGTKGDYTSALFRLL
jgi:hypothetical protein